MGHFFAAVAAVDMSPVCSEAECGVKEYKNIKPRQGRNMPQNSFQMSFKICIAPAGALLFFRFLPRIPLRCIRGSYLPPLPRRKRLIFLEWK